MVLSNVHLRHSHAEYAQYQYGRQDLCEWRTIREPVMINIRCMMMSGAFEEIALQLSLHF